VAALSKVSIGTDYCLCRCHAKSRLKPAGGFKICILIVLRFSRSVFDVKFQISQFNLFVQLFRHTLEPSSSGCDEALRTASTHDGAKPGKR
jgi:hypothetical protein